MKEIKKTVDLDLEKEEKVIITKAYLILLEMNEKLEHDDERHDKKPVLEAAIKAMSKLGGTISCMLGDDDVDIKVETDPMTGKNICNIRWNEI